MCLFKHTWCFLEMKISCFKWIGKFREENSFENTNDDKELPKKSNTHFKNCYD